MLGPDFVQLWQVGATTLSLRCSGPSSQWLLLVQGTDSKVLGFRSYSSWALELGLSSCGTQAWLLHDMWEPPKPGIEPASLVLRDGLLTTGPPGKFRIQLLRAVVKRIDFILGPTASLGKLNFMLGCSRGRRRRQWPPTPVLLPGKSHG